MKKKISLLLALALSLSLISCGSTADTTVPDSGTGTPSDSSSSSSSSDSSWNAALSSPLTSSNSALPVVHEMVAAMEEATGGALTVDVFDSGSLGGQRDELNALAAGEREIILDGSVPIDMFAPEYSFLAAPYLVRSEEHLEGIMNSEVWDGFAEKMAENNILVFGNYFRGARQTISTFDIDWAQPEKIIIRLPDVSSYITAWSAIGASGQVIGASEAYTSLETGTINATEGPLFQHRSNSMQEVCDNIYMTSHLYEFYAFYVSKSWYDSLSPEVQEAMVAQFDLYSKNLAEVCAEDEIAARDFLVENGMTIHEVDTQPLFERTNDVWNEKFESGEWASSLEEILALVP